MLLQHGGDDDELRGVRHACVSPLLLLHRQIPHHGHHHPWGGPPSGTASLEIFLPLNILKFAQLCQPGGHLSLDHPGNLWLGRFQLEGVDLGNNYFISLFLFINIDS